MIEQTAFLYKYKAIDGDNGDNFKWAGRIFTHNEIYFANANDFNDPFDCKFDFSFDGSNQDRKDYLIKYVKDRHPNWNRECRNTWIAKNFSNFSWDDPDFINRVKESNKKLILTVRICSFSEVPDDILMWSHYANGHQGFCLQFSGNEDTDFIANGPFNKREQKISYSDTYPIVNRFKDSDMETLKKSLLTKAKRWEYEKEWRMIDHKKGPDIKRFSPEMLVGVIFGCRMTEENQGQIREWCANRKTKISFYKAQEETQSYSLKIIGA
ncbi:MAG: hypothetical protein COA65_02430 [Rhodospirillaceae bacterium]|nr:MAG: hypothetical protein COA65_02430 [Rhodospirillaceae bacterium]